MKLKVLYLVIFLFLVCWKQSKNEIRNISELTEIEVVENTFSTKVKKKVNNNYNFDSVLKCQKYDYKPEDIYSWGDYGCVYAPNGNNIFGNLIIYLIPKIGISKYYDDYIGKEDEHINSEYDRVNNLSIKEIKKEFYIYLSLIDKKYLEHTPNLDASYNIKQSDDDSYKFVTEWFTYDNSTKKWRLLDSFETSPKTSRKAWEWEQEKVKEEIAKYQ